MISYAFFADFKGGPRHIAYCRSASTSKAKSEFLAVMSHELRTPLNAIIGFSDLMVREAMGPLQHPSYKEFAKDIKDGDNLLLSLVDDILEMTRVETGRFELQLEPIVANDFLQEMMGSFVSLASEKDVSVLFVSDGDTHRVLGDRRALRQSLTNLVSNGVKFVSKGGEVRLSVASGRSPGTVEFVVSDNGRGIASERIPELGRPFVQVGDSLRRETGGLGLGLAIARSLVQAMNGSLVIESELGAGTTVRVMLPSMT
jgi:signal transduction histidine kinase